MFRKHYLYTASNYAEFFLRIHHCQLRWNRWLKTFDLFILFSTNLLTYPHLYRRNWNNVNEWGIKFSGNLNEENSIQFIDHYSWISVREIRIKFLEMEIKTASNWFLLSLTLNMCELCIWTIKTRRSIAPPKIMWRHSTFVQLITCNSGRETACWILSNSINEQID